MAKRGTRILFGFLFFVVLAGGLAGGGAWYLTETRVEGYRATATVLLEDGYGPIPRAGAMAPPLGHPGPEGHGPDRALIGRLERATGLALSPNDTATLFTTDQIAAALKERLAALYTERSLEAVSWDLEQVRRAMHVEFHGAPAHMPDPSRRSLALHFTAENPEIAAAAANAWAEVVRDYADGLVQGEQAERLEELTSQREKRSAELAEALARQNEILQTTDLDALAQNTMVQAEATRTLKETLHTLEQNLARDEAALAALKAYVAKAPVAVVLELSVKEADLVATLAGSQAERDYVATRVAALDPAQQDDRAKLAEARRALEDAEDTVARLRPQIAALEEAEARLTTPANPVRIAATAVPPDSPAGPHRYVLVGGAAVLGALIGMIVYFALLTLRVYARELDRT